MWVRAALKVFFKLFECYKWPWFLFNNRIRAMNKLKLKLFLYVVALKNFAFFTLFLRPIPFVYACVLKWKVVIRFVLFFFFFLLFVSVMRHFINANTSSGTSNFFFFGFHRRRNDQSNIVCFIQTGLIQSCFVFWTFIICFYLVRAIIEWNWLQLFK